MPGWVYMGSTKRAIWTILVPTESFKATGSSLIGYAKTRGAPNRHHGVTPIWIPAREYPDLETSGDPSDTATLIQRACTSQVGVKSTSADAILTQKSHPSAV